ncbi:flagellar hook-associated protein FlgL [Bacillus marinisedimentorum]|uniref:flagellar hook-associated protein FlgL n=1 Tax=Bacillus marinisedimentorum TaxID=1821260 RepID=UPI0007DF772F|nr:flagellar hook-associated protein FlgL [Bacillus marinisedimentorum]
MRVTQSMLTNNMLKNLSNSYSRMGKYQDQLATGKKITKPSDDPVVAMKGMSYRTNLTEVEQYKRNLSEVYNWMENSDAAMDKATQVIQRVRELTVQASNGTYEEGQKAAIAKEVGQLKEHLTAIANTQVAGKYIFNGTNTAEKPFNEDGTRNSVKGPDVNIEVSKGVRIPVNIDGDQVFPAGLFTDLQKLEGTLNGTAAGDVGSFLSTLDGHMDNIVASRAEMGARYNRVELIEARVDEQEVIANRILSDNEDADIERVITELKTQESIHRAALGVGSRIMQPTLLDFLR